MAENKRYFWLKLMDDFFSSKRIKKLRKLAGGDTYTIIYLKMQLLSLQNSGCLEYTGLENEFYKEIALDIDEEEENVKITIQYLISCGLIEYSSDKEYVFPFVQNNLGSETASTRRSRKFRENSQKMLQCNTDATTCNKMQQKCNGDIDTDIDKESEIETESESEKEKESEIEKDLIVSIDTICSPENGKQSKKSTNDYFEIVKEEWNKLSEFGIAKVFQMTAGSTRKKQFKSRIDQYGIDNFLEAIENIKKSDFLQGKHKGDPWQITFDWFLKPNNFPKVLENNYKNNNHEYNGQGNGRFGV